MQGLQNLYLVAFCLLFVLILYALCGSTIKPVVIKEKRELFFTGPHI